MRHWPLIWNRTGAALVNAMVAVLAVAIAVPAIMGWVALSNWHDAESRALLHSYTLAQSELEWLQANCGGQIKQLLNSTWFEGQPITCTHYPRNVARSVPDKGVPNLRYTVLIEPLPGEPDVYEQAIVTIKVEWHRAFLMRTGGHHTYVGYLFGSSEDYWEFYPDWSSR